ncbi:MAG: Biopolymer transport protein ExbD/TolR [Bacteroidetes bacterium]|jgi:biopolymer transport protein ExbD|nr:Biopolymer transport protein ExbD/TolR [Bacteroidota bacterium]
MKIKRSKQFTPEVATSSLNDIMFFLLLFFLIVSTFANPNVIKVLLPKAQSAQAINKKQISITVTDDKKYFINDREVPFDYIKTELTARTTGLDNPTIILRFSNKLTIQDLVDILQIGNSLNIKMVLATQKE